MHASYVALLVRHHLASELEKEECGRTYSVTDRNLEMARGEWRN